MEIEKDKSVENVSNAQQDGARIVELEKEIKQVSLIFLYSCPHPR
jgi:hypothetical protein